MGETEALVAYGGQPISAEVWGWAASGLVLATFSMQSMRMLRLTAIASNLAFIGYGAYNQLLPILVLHAVLLPLNVWRLVQLQLQRAVA